MGAFAPYRYTVAQYQQMHRAGIFGPDKVELIEGHVYRKGPMNPPHAVSLERVGDELRARLPPDHCLRTEKDITLTASQPQPDAVIARGRRDDFATQHPFPSQIVLVVEVSDSTLDDDRTTKQAMYARAGIPVYWIVNIPGRQVEVSTDPVGGNAPRYQTVRHVAPPDSVTLAVGPHALGPIAVADLLPPP
jgi:Uma2 family endonuclease